MTIEIGTSDFRTQAGQVPGIFIEPVKYYFDRLPECTKENVAISNYTGMTAVIYLSEETIKHNNLPTWLRGCNSINEPHPTAVRILKEKGLSHYLFKRQMVEVARIKSIIDKHNVTEIDFLKIDTEGHDCVILNDYFDTVDIMPRKIQFEANELSDAQAVQEMTERLESLGYHCFKQKDDIIAVLG